MINVFFDLPVQKVRFRAPLRTTMFCCHHSRKFMLLEWVEVSYEYQQQPQATRRSDSLQPNGTSKPPCPRWQAAALNAPEKMRTL